MEICCRFPRLVREVKFHSTLCNACCNENFARHFRVCYTWQFSFVEAVSQQILRNLPRKIVKCNRALNVSIAFQDCFFNLNINENTSQNIDLP